MNKGPTRTSNRLRQYDYSKAGYYFVTLCIQKRVCLLGNVVNDQMVLNHAGTMIKNSWQQIPGYRDGIEMDACQIMPNHLHGIIILTGSTPRANVKASDPQTGYRDGSLCPSGSGAVISGRPQMVSPAMSLSDIIGRFKSLTANQYIGGVKHHQWLPFDKKLWQQSFHDHVIRNDQDLSRVREYIRNNPLKWALDEDNPDNWAQ